MYPLSVFLPFHNLYFPFFFFGFQYFSALKILPPSDRRTDRQTDRAIPGSPDPSWDPRSQIQGDPSRDPGGIPAGSGDCSRQARLESSKFQGRELYIKSNGWRFQSIPGIQSKSLGEKVEMSLRNQSIIDFLISFVFISAI